MIKKIFSILVILSLAFIILFISIQASLATKTTHAASVKFSVSPSPEATVSSVPKVEYFLPYPGILPDSPLYKIKMVRDRIWLWLTTETDKRATLLLLYADKRVGAGKALIEGNQISLGISTLIKAQKYLERAIAETEKARAREKSVETLIQSIQKASLKYEEILEELQGKINPDGKVIFDDLLKSLKNFQEKARNL